ncbi:Glycosyltransferase involved in cell wall bisynthesis [Eubacterium aggregans]|uniref:Glycosyltransferase involved in cell wall bisynthesis n=1 Tax=Eubacterium aggregans TaxID=81409 RepID=A0A1H3YB73_9FIRM|nr:glycosyltransferase family 2 protein [Eubacterium aggregans]SEA08261.1 Glycosyltransferase involved in cell wall bisynthesis [Eubacterium aggregans]
MISIIIPIYNVEAYLPRCIKSVINQTYRDLEILLIDDGSPDKCPQICDIYAQKDDRIRVIHKVNGGLSDARNCGINHATGEYLFFLDSDDWLHPNTIEDLYQLLIKQNADISVGNFLRTDSEEIKMQQENGDVFTYNNVEAIGQLFNEHYVEMVVAWGKIYRKNLFDSIRFPVGKLHEDEFTTYKLLYEAKKVVLTERAYLYYWQRADSIMGQKNIHNLVMVIEAYEERALFFENKKLYDYQYKTERTLFWQYMELLEREHFNLLEHQNDIRQKFLQLKKRLDNCKFSLKFTLFYRMYYFNPRITSLMLKIHKVF